MKRKFLIVSLVIASLLATYAISQTVTGENWVGYVKTNVQGGEFELIGVNFESVGSDNSVLLSEIISTNSLVADPDDIRLLSDRVFIWSDAESGYEEYWYTSAGFRDGAGPADPVLELGDAFWFKAAPGTEVREIYIIGQVSLDETSPVDFIGDASGKFNLFANPYPADFYLASNDWSNATADSVRLLSDRIFIWDGAGYTEYWLKDDGKWYVGNEEMDPATHLPVGGGAWYRARGDFSQVFNRPFDLE